MSANHIAFIGPMGVGKTSVAKVVSDKIGVKYIDVDELRWAYFEKQPDYDESTIEEFFKTGNELEAFRYFKPFEARLAVDFLNEMPEGVFDFGAGYSVYKDQALFDEVKSAFAKCRYVFFLRYSPDADESLAALHKRHLDISDDLYFSLNRDFIQSLCNALLATHVVDTKGKSPEQVVEWVLEVLNKEGMEHK